MQMLVIVVAEKTANGWSAWFRNSPQNVCVADSDVIAMLNLVEIFGTREMDFWDMTKLMLVRVRTITNTSYRRSFPIPSNISTPNSNSPSPD